MKVGQHPHDGTETRWKGPVHWGPVLVGGQMDCCETGREREKKESPQHSCLGQYVLGDLFIKLCIFQFISVHVAVFIPGKHFAVGLSNDRRSITNPHCGQMTGHESIFIAGTNI